MAINLAKARTIKYAHLGNDMVQYPACIYSTHPEIRDFTKHEKKRLLIFVEGILNEYVSYLYGRYGFNVSYVKIVDIMKSGPCRDTFYGKIDSLRLKPFRLKMNPTMKNAGSAAFMDMTLHRYVATAPDFMINWSPGKGLGYYESTSAVVRHEFGHCWGLHHETNLPSAVYGNEHSQQRLRIFGDDIHGITHMWRLASDPSYTQDCPDYYKRMPNGQGPKFPGVWGCMPDISSMPQTRIRNKHTNKCLYYNSIQIGQTICDETNNQQWAVSKFDEYGRHVICSSPDHCIRSPSLSTEQDKLEINTIDPDYSIWYLIPNEDGSFMFQQPESVKVMYSEGFSVRQQNPKGGTNERWFIEEYLINF